jgi:hypothetical protein
MVRVPARPGRVPIQLATEDWPRSISRSGGRRELCRLATPTGCFNLDPVTQTNCSTDCSPVRGQIITPSQDGNLGTIRLIYSTQCAANWAEADGLAPHVWIEVFNSLGESIIYQPNFNWGYTSTVDGVPPAGMLIYNSNRTAFYCVSQFNSCLIYPPT